MASTSRKPQQSLFATAALLAISGCRYNIEQSAVHPAGPAAAEIAWLWWFMLIAFTAVFLLVMALALFAIFRGCKSPGIAGDVPSVAAEPRPPLGATGFIVAGGVALPIFVLSILFIFSLQTSAALKQPATALTIRVVGRMWWWEVRYPEQGIVTANEIHIPAGRPVRLELTSADVIHSFWVPRLHGKRDLIPGIENEFWIEATEPGIYRGQCAEYCGTQHANMAFEVIAHTPHEFDEWLAGRVPTRAAASTPTVERGAAVFRKAGCGQCHAVRGTAAKGNVGPDLTHLASRRTIAAGMLPNNRGNLAGWIADPQAIKPGVKMPRTYLRGDDLLSLVTYLESLR